MGLIALALLPFAVGQGGIKVVVPGIPPVKGGEVSVNGNNGIRTLKGGGGNFAINGNGNRITITGNAARVRVNGNRNRVTVAGVGVIQVPGNGNTVTWSRGLGGKKPRVSVLGNRNRVVGLP